MKKIMIIIATTVLLSATAIPTLRAQTENLTGSIAVDWNLNVDPGQQNPPPAEFTLGGEQLTTRERFTFPDGTSITLYSAVKEHKRKNTLRITIRSGKEEKTCSVVDYRLAKHCRCFFKKPYQGVYIYKISKPAGPQHKRFIHITYNAPGGESYNLAYDESNLIKGLEPYDADYIYTQRY